MPYTTLIYYLLCFGNAFILSRLHVIVLRIEDLKELNGKFDHGFALFKEWLERHEGMIEIPPNYDILSYDNTKVELNKFEVITPYAQYNFLINHP